MSVTTERVPSQQEEQIAGQESDRQLNINKVTQGEDNPENDQNRVRVVIRKISKARDSSNVRSTHNATNQPYIQNMSQYN